MLNLLFMTNHPHHEKVCEFNTWILVIVNKNIYIYIKTIYSVCWFGLGWSCFLCNLELWRTNRSFLDNWYLLLGHIQILNSRLMGSENRDPKTDWQTVNTVLASSVFTVMHAGSKYLITCFKKQFNVSQLILTLSAIAINS